MANLVRESARQTEEERRWWDDSPLTKVDSGRAQAEAEFPKFRPDEVHLDRILFPAL